MLDDDAGGIFQSIRFWQGWAVLATIAALFTFIAHAEFPLDGHTPDYVGIVGDGGAPLWVVNADLGGGVLEVRAEAAKPAPDGRRHVLWIGGEHPQRVGLLPVDRDRATLPLTNAQAALLGHGKAIAVSLAADMGEGQGEPEFAHQAGLTRL